MFLQTQLEFGLPERFETPKVCQVQQRSIMIGWFAGNPMTFGAASRTFQVQVSGGGKVRYLFILFSCTTLHSIVSSQHELNYFR